MLNSKLQAIVLAAGKAKRFKTGRTKLLEKICGQEMILYATKMLEQLKIKTTIVVGHQKNDIQRIITDHHADTILFAHQEKQLGTGHAVLCTKEHWQSENILVLNGDMPLITEEIIIELYQQHSQSKAAISFVISHLDHPNHSYGRVIKHADQITIVEAKDFKGDPNDHCWINAGIYLINKNFLEKYIEKIESNNANNEFYLTDLVGIASDQSLSVKTVSAPFDRIRGVNNLEELWVAEQIKRAELVKYWMHNGVRFIRAQDVHLDANVTIGAGSCIVGSVYLEKGTKIGKNCTIKEYTRIENTQIGDNTTIHSHCVITDSYINQHANIGPFAHLRTDTIVEQNSTIGNFVEIKKSIVGENSQARHLAYLGNATIGKNVNIGAGTITCNHNGFTKKQTIIKDNAFIGSNNTLVAPLIIGEHAFTAAGSTITNDVPKETVAFGRTKQINKEGYVPILLKKLQIELQKKPKKNEQKGFTNNKKENKQKEL